MTYGRYLHWRGLLPVEPPRHPEPGRVSSPAANRNAGYKFGFPRSDTRGTIVTFTIDKLSYSLSEHDDDGRGPGGHQVPDCLSRLYPGGAEGGGESVDPDAELAQGEGSGVGGDDDRVVRERVHVEELGQARVKVLYFIS